MTGLVLVAATILGGGTRTGFSGDVITQFLAVVLLVVVATNSLKGERDGSWVLSRSDANRLLPIVIVGFSCLLIVLQLLPLPPELWSKLTGDSFVGSGLDLVGVAGAWRPISLTPHATWASAASLLVPIAVFFGTARLDAPSRLKLCWLVLALGAMALILGLLQIAQGPLSELRFFEITNPTEAVGFFANRNHFAAQLYVTLMLAAVLFIPTVQDSLQPGAQYTRAVFWFACAAAFVIAIMAGLAMARSRAGIFLAMAAVVGIAAMAMTNRRAFPAGNTVTNTRLSVSRVSLAVVGFATVFALQFGLHRILTRFAIDSLEDLRLRLFHTTLETAIKAIPFGTGLGSFVPVYASVEKANDVFRSYANRAHNDYAEFLLEAGIFSAIILLVFLWWFVSRGYAIWFRAKRDSFCSAQLNHLLLQQASTIVIILLLAHSFVDYPLRTTALAALFAFSCATLVPPLDFSVEQGRIDRPLETDEQSQTFSQVSLHQNEPVQQVLRRRWGADVEWPEAWQEKNNNAQDDEDA